MNPNLHFRNLEVERRKSKRDKADFLFEAHRDNCKKCEGKSFQEIKTLEFDVLKCHVGSELARKAYLANRKVAHAS